jgi:uncharacterized coiled-coil DUF342 family protein
MPDYPELEAGTKLDRALNEIVDLRRKNGHLRNVIERVNDTNSNLLSQVGHYADKADKLDVRNAELIEEAGWLRKQRDQLLHQMEEIKRELAAAPGPHAKDRVVYEHIRRATKACS